MEDKPLKLYITAKEESIGVLLAQDNEDGKEQAIYYLSKFLDSCEYKYSAIEKLCLILYFVAKKLTYYLFTRVVHVITSTDLIKYMLIRSILSGNIGK